jgi:hypothetical protein
MCAWLLAVLALPGMVLAAPQQEPPPSSDPVPNGAWALESISITAAGVGFVVLAVGATILGRRDQIITDFKNPSTFNTNPVRPKAADIKGMEDTGQPLVIVGLIVAGVGVAGMLVGGIWILAHRPKTSTKSSTKVSKSQPPTGSPASARTLLLQTP